MSKVVSLPMYNLPGMRGANAALWAALSGHLRKAGYSDLPAELSSSEDYAPEPLFTQVCGYPLQTIYRGRFRLLATPSYDAPGCTPLRHSAFVVVRANDAAQGLEDLRGRRFAVNSLHSNSGMNLARHLFAPCARGGRFFGEVIHSGSHARSLALIQSGSVDAASIDCVTWALIEDYAPDLKRGVRVLAHTSSSPAIPFVTGITTPPDMVEALRRALVAIGTEPAYRDVRAPLRLKSIGRLPETAYSFLLLHEQEAKAAGYAQIA